MAAALIACAAPLTYARAQPVAAASVSRAEQALRPGDKVKLTIWREPDLSGEFEVQPDGGVTFPKIGRIEIEQLSPDSLKALIVSRYAVSLRDPSIEVTPLRRIVVSGSVRDAGYHYADPTVTVQGALALAGGITTEGDRKRIELARGGEVTSIKLSNAPSLADSPVQSGDEVTAPERSWASRNTGLIASGLTGVALIVAAIIRP